MTDLGTRAIARAQSQSASGPRIDDWLNVSPSTGWCLKAVRTCYGVDALDFTPNDGKSPWAVEAYEGAENQHPTKNPADIPRGVPVFWSKDGRPGHIAIATGNGNCYSTDISRPGYFDEVPISRISTTWGMTLLGWTEDLNRVRVYEPPAPISTRVIDHAVDDLARAIAARKPGPKRAALRTARQAVIVARRIVKEN